MLLGLAANDPEGQARIGAFLQTLQQLGWTDGRNIQILRRFTDGDPDRARTYAAELVAFAPDVVLTSGASTVGLMLQATRTVPVVFAEVADPVGAGFVNSLALPGGNATGFTTYEYSMSGKWLDLLKEIAPRPSGRPRCRCGHRLRVTRHSYGARDSHGASVIGLERTFRPRQPAPHTVTTTSRRWFCDPAS